MGRTMIHSRSLSRRRFSCASFSAYSSLSSGGTSTFMKNAPANPGSCLLSPTPHAVWHTKRRRPCSSIAAMMLAEPAETGPCGSPGLRGCSGLLGCREPRTLITASLPATASCTFPASEASPTTTLSRPWRALILEGLLTKAVTSCPSAIALSTRRRPVPPVGPKIANLMVAPYLPPSQANVLKCTQSSPADLLVRCATHSYHEAGTNDPPEKVDALTGPERRGSTPRRARPPPGGAAETPGRGGRPRLAQAP